MFSQQNLNILFLAFVVHWFLCTIKVQLKYQEEKTLNHFLGVLISYQNKIFLIYMGESKAPKCWLTICANLKPFLKTRPKVSKRQEENACHAKREVEKLAKSKLWKGSYEVQQQQKEWQEHTQKKKDNEMSLLLEVMKKVQDQWGKMETQLQKQVPMIFLLK